MRILCIGDVVGKPGRKVVRQLLPRLIDRLSIDLVIANAENAAGGVGLTSETARELLECPIDLLTSGNHIWKYREINSFLEKEPRLIRPLNYPDGAPGRGVAVVERDGHPKVGVVNLVGRIFMDPVTCPFDAAEQAAEQLSKEAPIILVEIHAEATSEKRAIGHLLDGRVSAVYGTHTHVATADEEILAGGTGYISDIGMTGPYDSVIGMKKHEMIQRMRTLRPVSFEVARGDLRLCGVLFDIDPDSGKCRSVQRIREALTPS
jgi:metallophosphoesterase (TIGR00282 family)